MWLKFVPNFTTIVGILYCINKILSKKQTFYLKPTLGMHQQVNQTAKIDLHKKDNS